MSAHKPAPASPAPQGGCRAPNGKCDWPSLCNEVAGECTWESPDANCITRPDGECIGGTMAGKPACLHDGPPAAPQSPCGACEDAPERLISITVDGGTHTRTAADWLALARADIRRHSPAPLAGGVEVPEEPESVSRARNSENINNEAFTYIDALRAAATAMQAERDRANVAHRYSISALNGALQKEMQRVESAERDLGLMAKAVKDFSVIAGLHDKAGSAITIRDGLRVWTERHAPALELARRVAGGGG